MATLASDERWENWRAVFITLAKVLIIGSGPKDVVLFFFGAGGVVFEQRIKHLRRELKEVVFKHIGLQKGSFSLGARCLAGWCHRLSRGSSAMGGILGGCRHGASFAFFVRNEGLPECYRWWMI